MLPRALQDVSIEPQGKLDLEIGTKSIFSLGRFIRFFTHNRLLDFFIIKHHLMFTLGKDKERKKRKKREKEREREREIE